MSNQSISVTSHVSRDFLQNAAYFNTLSKVVWEYISNSLDNGQEGKLVEVSVDITPNQITIRDNACGMSRQDLVRFFQMHGINLQRQRGKIVRGQFGTGKCAAFGIANKLQIDTVNNGHRNIVELNRRDIELAKDGQPFPVMDIQLNEITEDDNGSIITISEINTPKYDLSSIISYVERHLRRYASRGRVFINGNPCEFIEPPSRKQMRFPAPAEVEAALGSIVLEVKISPVPLEKDFNGIDILSQGIWHESTLVSIQGKSLSEFIFGEIDVPVLETLSGPIPPFDNTRNNTLNIANPMVAILMGWISQELEKVRQDLIEEDRKKKQSQETKDLDREADRIAAILNNDFKELEIQLEHARRIASRGGRIRSGKGSETEMPLPGGGEIPTGLDPAGHIRQGEEQAGEQHNGDGGDTQLDNGPSTIEGHTPGSINQIGKKRKQRGAFQIVYEHMGANTYRSHFNRELAQIFINLDHPQIAGALQLGGIESRGFRDVTYEVAIVEYAQAISFVHLEKLGDLYAASEALFDVKETIERLSRKVAGSLGPGSR